MSEPSPAQILLISPENLGNACLAVPAVRALCNTVGTANVTVACVERLVDFWQQEVGEVISLRKEPSDSVLNKALKKHPAELVVNLTQREMFKFWGAEEKLFVMRKEHDRAIGTPIGYSNPKGLKHEVERFLAVPELFSMETQKKEYYPRRAKQALRGKIAVIPTSEYGTAYHNGLDCLHDFFNHTLEHKGLTIYEYDQTFSTGFAPVKLSTINLDKLSLGELMDELKLVDMLIAPEGGNVHLAAYLGTPTVTIFGPGNPFMTRPLGVFHSLVFTKVACQPCLMAKCLLDQRCTKNITTQELSTAVTDLLAVLR